MPRRPTALQSARTSPWAHRAKLALVSIIAACDPSCPTDEGEDPPCGQIGDIEIIDDVVTVDPAQTMDVTGQAYNDCTPKAAINSSGWVWTTNDPSVATVAPLVNDVTKARILGVTEGTTTIRATVSPPSQAPRAYSDVVTVMVRPLSSLTVTPASASLLVAQSLALTAHATNMSGSDITVPITWTSEDPQVATVTGGVGTTATVFGVAQGTTTVTATVGSVSADVPVAVAGQSMSSTVFGVVKGYDDVKLLPGMRVAISRSGTGIGNATTDAGGAYSIDVTPGGDLRIIFQGVCDIDPMHDCNDELSFNSSELEQVVVAVGEDKRFDPRAQRGYHLRITNPPADQTVGTNHPFTVPLNYQVWNRAFLDGAAPRMVVGIDDDAQSVTVFGVPHVHPGTTGTANVQLTAPSTIGTYYVYALLVTATGTLPADSIYEANFQAARLVQYVRMFKLTVQ